MNATVVLLVVVLFSFVVGHSVDRFASKYVTPSGIEYLLFGLLVNPHIPPRLVSVDELAKLTPFVSLVLGLVGFVLGLRVRRSIRDLESAMVGVAVGVFVFVVVGGAAATLMPLLGLAGDGAPIVQWVPLTIRGYVLEIEATERVLLVGAALGAAAAISSTAINDSVLRATKADGPMATFSRSVTCATSAVGVILFGLALATGRANEAAGRMSIGITEWALLAVATAAVCGLLFRLFLGKESDPSRIFLASVGAVIFASGIGSALGISPLFVNLVAGVTVGATSSQATHVRDELERLQQPIFALLMVFAGALWVPGGAVVWALAVAYFAIRFVAWWVVPSITMRLFVDDPPQVGRVGRAFAGQGTIAVAIGLSVSLRDPALSPIILTTILVSVVVSDLFSERQLRAVLLDAGEVPEPEVKS